MALLPLVAHTYSTMHVTSSYIFLPALLSLAWCPTSPPRKVMSSYNFHSHQMSRVMSQLCRLSSGSPKFQVQTLRWQSELTNCPRFLRMSRVVVWYQVVPESSKKRTRAPDIGWKIDRNILEFEDVNFSPLGRKIIVAHCYGR